MSLNAENQEDKILSATQSGSVLEKEREMTGAGETNLSAENGINNIRKENGAKKSQGRPSKRAKNSPKGKHVLRSVNTPRILRSRSKEKCETREPSSNFQDQSAGPAGISGENIRKKNKIKKTRTKEVVVDEFSRTKKHLRYLLHRMAYEQNLIDAYSGEGWKGQSAEKLRPEKELQRAKSEILRIKLKIRDLFQRIDVLITEGRLPQSLFDEEGEIDSEDIFCAKCGLKDVTLENDIILCDGACERAFHQFCVQPPLLNEDIPPDEEGWLCPGCDCKDDCIDLINDSQGTHLNILDSWEKVYPEAAAAAAAGKSLDNLDLPSDDSEDDDFKPDESEVDEREGDESSSDESDTNSGSEEAEVAPVNGQNLQLPSDDDSEDDDFNPDAADVDEEVKKESSGSDFTSDSEDLNALIQDNNGSPNENKTMPNDNSSKVGRGERPLLNDESSSPLETTSVISARREVERLDYKKLYDEQYGDVPTDSSDEEFFDAVDAPKRRRKYNNDTEKAPKRKASKKLDNGGTNNSPINTNKAPSELGTTCVIAKTSPLGRLGETSVQEQSRNVSTDSSNEEYFDAADAPKRRRNTNMDDVKSPKRKTCKKIDTAGANDTPVKSNKVSSEPGSSSAQAKASAYKRLGEAATQGLLISFKENQYPERATKEKLAADLGITTHQVSKWFENARHSYRHSPHLESKLGDIPSKGTPSKIVSSNNKLNIPVDDLKNGDRSEDTKDPTISVEIQRKVGNRGTCNGEESASSIPNKSSTTISSNNFPSNEDTQKSRGSVEVSKTPEKRTRGRRKKSNV